MDDQELRKLLEQLHSEINDAKTVDEKGVALLRDLGADIRDLLERSESAQLQLHPSTLQRMQDSIDYFEVTHPTLTAMLSKLSAILSNAGI